ncbi:hypothetical protein ACH0B6_19780 [Solibacillus silvestris]
MKKVLTGFVVLLLIITASNMILKKDSNKTASVNTEAIESTLVKSMEETKEEKKKLELFLTKSSQALNDKGYQAGIGFSHEERNVTVQVQNKAFLEANKTNIEKIIHNTAKKIGFQNYTVDFLALDNYPVLSEEDEKQRKTMVEVVGEISALLKEREYPPNSISTNLNNEILIEMQGMKEDFGKSKEIEELEKFIDQTILQKTDLEYTVRIQKKSEIAIRDQQWQPILSTISEETKKRFKEYRGFAYSFHPEPLQIIIKTNIHSSKWFGNSDKKINQITEYVDKIIELKREELSIEEIPYEIIIRDKNDKEVK